MAVREAVRVAVREAVRVAVREAVREAGAGVKTPDPHWKKRHAWPSAVPGRACLAVGAPPGSARERRAPGASVVLRI